MTVPPRSTQSKAALRTKRAVMFAKDTLTSRSTTPKEVPPSPPRSQPIACGVWSVLAVLAAPLLFGIIIGSTGPTIDTMKNDVRDVANNVLRLPENSKFVVFTPSQASIYSALVTIGCMVGALVGGTITEGIGFKKTIWFTIPFYCVSWLLMGYVSNVALLYFARIMTGFAVGVNSFTVPTYIGEAAPVRLRGLLGAANQLSVTLGILLVYALGLIFRVSGGGAFSPSTDEGIPLQDLSNAAHRPTMLDEAPANSFCNWRMLSMMNLVPTIILAVCVIFIPESPRWLASKGKGPEAKQALMSLRGGQPLPEEVAAIDSALADSESHGGAELIDLFLGARKQLGIAIALQFFQQFSGINAVMFFCTSIMRQARMRNAAAISVSVMFEQVIVTAIACVLMDVAGRRVLLISGASAMAFASFLFSLYFYLAGIGMDNIMGLVFVSVYLYIAAFSIGVGAIPWLILGEIFPPELRAIGASVATTFNWIFAFIVTLVFQTVSDKIAYTYILAFFGICCVGLVVYASLYVPETKGKTFEEIQKHFHGGYDVQGDEEEDVEEGHEHHDGTGTQPTVKAPVHIFDDFDFTNFLHPSTEQPAPRPSGDKPNPAVPESSVDHAEPSAHPWQLQWIDVSDRPT